MPKWICLLRGINVGGKHVLPMKSLCEILQSIGCTDIETYIQSGNAVFNSSERGAKKLADLISDNIESTHSFRPAVMMIKPKTLNSIIEANPFASKTDPGKTIHCFFLGSKAASADLESMNAIKSPSEEFQLSDDAYFLFAPDGIGRSKLAAKVEKLLGVPTTARNWKTVLKLQEMID